MYSVYLIVITTDVCRFFVCYAAFFYRILSDIPISLEHNPFLLTVYHLSLFSRLKR